MNALRAKLRTDEDLRPVIDGMMELNRAAAEAMLECDVHACTDVTGFGLAGHLHEMLAAGVRSAPGLGRFAAVRRRSELSGDYCRPGKTFGIIDWASAFVEQGGIDDFEFDDRMGVLVTRKPPAACSWPSRPKMQAVSRRSASSVKGATLPHRSVRSRSGGQDLRELVSAKAHAPHRPSQPDAARDRNKPSSQQRSRQTTAPLAFSTNPLR